PRGNLNVLPLRRTPPNGRYGAWSRRPAGLKGPNIEIARNDSERRDGDRLIAGPCTGCTQGHSNRITRSDQVASLRAAAVGRGWQPQSIVGERWRPQAARS